MAAARRGHTTLAVFVGLALCLGALAAIGSRGSASADPATVVPHRHFMQTPSGLVEIGPRACDDPAARDAFARFHSRVHGSSPQGQRVAITTRACSITR